MPAIKKPEHLKLSSAKVLVYVPESLKKEMDAMSQETGVSTSQRVRDCIESEIKKWKAKK